jgi:hypothetical protein
MPLRVRVDRPVRRSRYAEGFIRSLARSLLHHIPSIPDGLILQQLVRINQHGRHRPSRFRSTLPVPSQAPEVAGPAAECQHFESQRWLERQTQRLVPGNYFLVTFTLPAELRPLAWQHQRIVYDLLMDCAWQTLRTFSQNHRHLHGTPGAIAVLHTHARDLHFHPHVHLVIPAAALDGDRRL